MAEGSGVEGRWGEGEKPKNGLKRGVEIKCEWNPVPYPGRRSYLRKSLASTALAEIDDDLVGGGYRRYYDGPTLWPAVREG